MASKTDICNLALICLGEPTINSPSEPNKWAAVMNHIYEIARDKVLADHPWNFAMRRASLNAVPAEAPPFEFAFSYQLPGDCLKVRYTEDQWYNRQSGNYYPWKVRGRYLETDHSDCKISYTKRVEEEGYFSPGFVVAFGYYLAYMAAMSSTEHRGQTEGLLGQYKNELIDAKFQDAQEGTSDAPEEGNWLEARV